jgi:LAO/AO transport system kinase
MSDLFLLLLAPAGGDELQGVKRGIMEIADMILINKADGALKPVAMRTCADYAGALRLLRKRPEDPKDFPKAMTVSAVSGDGLETAWEEIATLAEWRRENGFWDSRRAAQARHWFEEEVRYGLLARLTNSAEMRGHMKRLGDKVAMGELAPAAAADEMLRLLGAG